MKKFYLFFIVLFCIVFSFLTLNCETGLGEAVDVETPRLSITYPPANSAIRDWFVVAGSCSDDQGVAFVYVSVISYDDNNNAKTVWGPNPAVVASDKSSWQINVNEVTATNPNAKAPFEPEKIFEIKEGDGTYIVQAYAVDAAGRRSDTMSRSIDIDNTAPVLLLNKPLALADAETPSSYGRILKLAGDASDDHNLVLSLYMRQVDKPTGKGGGYIYWRFNTDERHERKFNVFRRAVYCSALLRRPAGRRTDRTYKSL